MWLEELCGSKSGLIVDWKLVWGGKLRPSVLRIRAGRIDRRHKKTRLIRFQAAFVPKWPLRTPRSLFFLTRVHHLQHYGHEGLYGFRKCPFSQVLCFWFTRIHISLLALLSRCSNNTSHTCRTFSLERYYIYV